MPDIFSIGTYLNIQQIHSYPVLDNFVLYFWIPKPSETNQFDVRKTIPQLVTN